ncbi:MULTISPECIES: N-acetylneuraminate synthase family protein [Leptospira]|uniref:N-acetylneuraminic acid (Sialic acid) synthetase n=3 Tax=Leptospira borgpetersenii serovar Hardjo-bovis TaxID=338217 RepID=Q04TM5_LEPBJ|nr:MULTISPECIES: N-acetylneuraminate synthase family protein [Leptospira]ABJ75745.1 N-acetylneuraminic acid (sialic acid) synthetase [Leptospira borgpetersenii serovar Hardjo-bovis str. JB197]ABJ78689.1 N-acetylneuraminic acid (sialic acid) synthetase [Leptospira borgpetersenii serovar Hardjo-bovis str. L550]AMX57976.1 acetylneuraminic acid synthetase [Leptospira borgpetersenii serovar Hardjo]AMX61207.1 acetylneuraminic acid synthetase [Leptospira borgpetersenii serovar Hardjo]AMX64451.1 acety
MSQEITLGNIKIGGNNPVFIIAEAGLNHGGDLNLALRMIDEAADAKANAIKFQAYNSEERFGENKEAVNLVKPAEFGKKEFLLLKERSQKKNILFFATPFDVPNLNMLKEIGVEILKIASCDICNITLLEAAADSGLIVILSRGTASASEIETAVSIFKKKKSPFILLHCVSSYPMNEIDANLSAIQTLKSKYEFPIGYSDHSKGIEIPLLAVASGAEIIEKHYTVDRTLQGIDWEISAEPKELAKLVTETERIRKILGHGKLEPQASEQEEIEYRNSLRRK